MSETKTEGVVALPTVERVRELLTEGAAALARHYGEALVSNSFVSDTASILRNWLEMREVIDSSMPALVAGVSFCEERKFFGSAKKLRSLAALVRP